MKSNAALKLEHTLDTEPDDNEESWHTQNDFAPSIHQLQESLPADQKENIEGQKCFGWLWEDETGVCPEDGQNGDLCLLRSTCQVVWNQVQTQRAARANQKKRKVIAPKKERPSQSKKKASDQFYRRGYEFYGRPVDTMAAAFMDALDDPPILPRIFNAANFDLKYGHLGPCTVTKTASYHGVYHRGTLVARFWTNAAKAAIIDIVPEVVVAATKVSSVMGTDSKDNRLVSKPIRVPSTMVKKSHPCTHRVKVRSTAAAIEVAKILKRKFRWRKNTSKVSVT